MALPVFRNSEGDFVCKECSKVYITLDEANICARSHPDEVKKVAMQKIIGAIPPGVDIGVFTEMVEKGNVMGAAGKICLMMVEDYLLCRKFDIERSQRPGPLTMTFAKNAADSMINLSKITGSSNVDVSDRASDVDALKEMMTSFKENDI